MSRATTELEITEGYPLTATPDRTIPILSSISSNVGILAGGTRITATGQNFPQRQALMSYGGYAAASLEACLQTTCFFMTPPGNSSDVGVQLPILLTFNGQAPITTGFTFTYKPNPRVNSIHPLKTLAAGGTTLTVDGEGFDSVNDPQLIVHMLHTIKDSGSQNETMFTSSCTVNTSDTLKCPTPELEIPERLKNNKLDNQKSTTGDQNSDAEYLLDTEEESLEIYLGIKLDGDQSYTDLRESLPEYSHIKVFILEPEFDTFEDTKEVSGNERLHITGKRLSDGLDITDYKITIGVGTCTVVDMTVNTLVCLIPEEDGQQEQDEHSVLVHPGTNLTPQLIGNVNPMLGDMVLLFIEIDYIICSIILFISSNPVSMDIHCF